jgi:hypothetical protein
LGNAKHGCHRTQDGVRNALTIGDGLVVVVVLLTTMENGAIAHLVEGQSGYVVETYAIIVMEGEVFGDKRDRVWARPERVFDPGVCGVVVIAPFAFAAAGITAEEDPVAESGREAVRGS